MRRSVVGWVRIKILSWMSLVVANCVSLEEVLQEKRKRKEFL